MDLARHVDHELVNNILRLRDELVKCCMSVQDKMVKETVTV